jgi:hypothetical protein
VSNFFLDLKGIEEGHKYFERLKEWLKELEREDVRRSSRRF